MISKSMDYALRALTHMARNPQNEWFGAKTLAEHIGASPTYLGKILQQLVRAGLLTSVTGPGGGFRLAFPPQDLKLIDILYIMDGERIHEACFLGLGKCSNDTPCPFHETWKHCRELLVRDFRGTSVLDAAQKKWPRMD